MLHSFILATCLAARSDGLPIDPASLLLWKEAVDFVTAHEAEIWPGFDISEIPALLTHPNVGEILLRHPRPPAGFHALDRDAVPEALGSEPTWIRRGTTLYSVPKAVMTGFGGVPTLVVADHKLFAASDAWYLGAIVHEGFHAWAATHLKIAAIGDSGLIDYPNLGAVENAHLELEGRALGRALRATAASDVREQAVIFLAERLRRREQLPTKAIAWEDGNELVEGLAKFVELRAQEIWSRQGVSAPLAAALPALLDTRAFADARRAHRATLRDSSRGTLGYEGHPFGPAAVRCRGYWFGAALGGVLEQLSSGWKSRVAHGATLTNLLREAIGDPSDAELALRADGVERAADFATLVLAKRDVAAGAEEEGTRRIAAVLGGAGTLVVIDVSAVATRVPLRPRTYSSFGVLRVDEHRLLFSIEPTTFAFGPVRVEIPADPGVIVDEEARTLTTRVARAPELFQTFAWFSKRPFVDSGLTIDSPSLTTKREGEAIVRITLQGAK